MDGRIKLCNFQKKYFFQKKLAFLKKLVIISSWLVGQAVKTPPSHGGIRGSIPLQAARNRISDGYPVFCLSGICKQYRHSPPLKKAGFLAMSKGNPKSGIPFLFFFFLFIWKSWSNVYSYIRSSFRLHKFFQLRRQLFPVLHIFHDCFFHRIDFILDLCQL